MAGSALRCPPETRINWPSAKDGIAIKAPGRDFQSHLGSDERNLMEDSPRKYYLRVHMSCAFIANACCPCISDGPIHWEPEMQRPDQTRSRQPAVCQGQHRQPKFWLRFALTL
eukprot:39573_1